MRALPRKLKNHVSLRGYVSRNFTRMLFSQRERELHLVAIGQRFIHRHFIDVFKVTADRHAHREPCDA